MNNLDLQLVCIAQVIDRDPKTATGDLLDRRALGIAVLQRNKAFGVLPSLTGIRLATHAVHGDGQRFVRFRADGTKTHGPGREALNDLTGRFYRVKADTLGRVIEIQQTAQRCFARIVVVDLLGKGPVGVLAVSARCCLKTGDRLRIPHMGIAMASPVEIARIWQHADGCLIPLRVANEVPTLHFFSQHCH